MRMLITRESDYALRILRALAEGEQVTVGEICQRERLPQQFAYKVLRKLSKAGLVKVTRGAEGGCHLTADLNAVSLYELLQVMEEDGRVISCMEPDFRCQRREECGGCVAHQQLAKVQASLDRELKAHSLEEILHGKP